MKSFLDWMKDNNPGNYVSIDVSDLPVNLISSDDGTINSKPHVTLMYSKASGIHPDQIQNSLNRYNIAGSKATVHGVTVFPDSSTPGKSAIVLELLHPELNRIHDAICAMGCKHSFIPFRPHATMLYGVDDSKTKEIVDRISPEIIGKNIMMGEIHSTPVKENWVDSLNKK